MPIRSPSERILLLIAGFVFLAVAVLHLARLMFGINFVLGGVLLAIDLFVPVVAFILGLHLLVIVTDIGLDAIGVRDAAIMFATFALVFLGGKAKQNPS